MDHFVLLFNFSEKNGRVTPTRVLDAILWLRLGSLESQWMTSRPSPIQHRAGVVKAALK